MKEKFVIWAIRFRNWIAGFGVLGFALWFLVKWIICTFFGICLL